jgi:hypothetical protein
MQSLQKATPVSIADEPAVNLKCAQTTWLARNKSNGRLQVTAGKKYKTKAASWRAARMAS